MQRKSAIDWNTQIRSKEWFAEYFPQQFADLSDSLENVEKFLEKLKEMNFTLELIERLDLFELEVSHYELLKGEMTAIQQVFNKDAIDELKSITSKIKSLSIQHIVSHKGRMDAFQHQVRVEVEAEMRKRQAASREDS